YEPSALSSNSSRTRTYTFGATSPLSNSVTNDFRLNVSSNEVVQSSSSSSFGGAVPIDISQLQGFTTTSGPSPQLVVGLLFGSQTSLINLSSFSGRQKQWNIIDSVGLSRGRNK